MAAQAAVDKERAELEAHKEKAIKGMGDGVAPFVLERHLAWVRDRQIKECLDTRKFADPEIDLGYQADATSSHNRPRARAALRPAEARAALVRRRAAQCSVVLLVVDDWLYESRTVRSFLTWVTAVHAMVEEDGGAAARIQQFVRDKKEAASTRSWSPPPPRGVGGEAQAAQPVPVPGDGGGAGQRLHDRRQALLCDAVRVRAVHGPLAERWATAS